MKMDIESSKKITGSTKITRVLNGFTRTQPSGIKGGTAQSSEDRTSKTEESTNNSSEDRTSKTEESTNNSSEDRTSKTEEPSNNEEKQQIWMGFENGKNKFCLTNSLGSSVLILGDGNLSFSMALSKMFPKKRITATVLEERQEWMEKYGSQTEKAALDWLESENNPNISVIFEVDATRLAESPFHRNTFSDIIFNFPHHGGKTNLKKSRTFLRLVFESVAKNLMSRSGLNRFHLTLAPGQSGIDPAIVSQQKYFCLDGQPPVHNKDSWQPLELAAEYGLVADTVLRFEPSLFAGYTTSGYLNTNQQFNNDGNAHTITFNWIGHLTGPEHLQNYKAKFLEMAGQRLRMATYDKIPEPIFHQFRPWHRYHLSVIFGKVHKCGDREYMNKLEQNLFRQIHHLAGSFLVRIFEMPEKRCLGPQRRHNRIYCLQYQGIAVPLCKKQANIFHEFLSRFLKNELRDLTCDIDISAYDDEEEEVKGGSK